MKPLFVAPRPLFAYRHGELEMDGASLAELAAHHGTPLFVVSERRLVENLGALRSGLAAAGVEVVLRYCAKANHEAGVLAVLAREGAAVLASHAAEVDLALACGFPPSRIAYQRPATSASEVTRVVAAGVRLVHVFRPEDVSVFDEVARRSGASLRLSLRLRDEGRGFLSPLAALNRRLGLSTKEALDVARTCAGTGTLRVAALNVYVGTQQPGLRAFDAALRRACELAARVDREGVVAIEEINLGGGIPSPSLARIGPRRLWSRWRDRAGAAGSSPEAGGGLAGLESFAVQVAERYRMAAASCGLSPVPALAAEPGRSIVGNAAVLIARVVSADRGWVFVDASRNVLGESPLLFSRRILPLREPHERARRFVHLSGGTLNTTDVLDLHRRLPPLRSGDLLAFCDAGAYSISRASRYAGMAPPVLLLGADGVARPIRRAETFEDLVAPMAPALGAEQTARRGPA